MLWHHRRSYDQCSYCLVQKALESGFDILPEVRSTLWAPAFHLQRRKLARIVLPWLLTLVCRQVGQVWEV